MAEAAYEGIRPAPRASGTEDGAYFWFAPRVLRSRLPFWLAPFVLPFAMLSPLILLDWAVLGSFPEADVMYPIHLLVFVFAAVYIARRMNGILDYAESLGAGHNERIRRRLYSLGWTAAMFIPIEGFYVGSTVLTPGFGLEDLFRRGVLPGMVHVFIAASGIWTFVYSMKSLRDVGLAPLSLKPFTEDRALGLRPFGIGALRLVTIYELAVLAGALPAIFAWDLSWGGLPVFTLLALLGFVFFFLPLFSFRWQIREAKARELSWIRPRYAELVNAIRENGPSYVDEKVVGSLNALDKIQRDVEQIRAWPFDAAVATRLASVTVLPLSMAVLARAVMILILHV